MFVKKKKKKKKKKVPPPKGKGRASPSGKIPTSEDYSKSAVRRAVLSEAVQHPATIIPGAVAVVGGIGLAVFGVTPPGIVATVGGGSIAVGSWVYNWFARGDKFAEVYLKKLSERRSRYQLSAIGDIEEACVTAGFSEGAKEARELTEAYKALRSLLKEKYSEQKVDLDSQRFLILAEDAYQEGVGILSEALNSFRALQSIDIKKFDREHLKWSKELEQLGQDALPARREALESKIGTHRKVREKYRELEESVYRLVAQSNELEGAIIDATLEISRSSHGDAHSHFQNHGAALRLQSAVEAARDVEVMIKDIGHGFSKKEEEEFLRAAEQG